MQRIILFKYKLIPEYPEIKHKLSPYWLKKSPLLGYKSLIIYLKINTSEPIHFNIIPLKYSLQTVQYLAWNSRFFKSGRLNTSSLYAIILVQLFIYLSFFINVSYFYSIITVFAFLRVNILFAHFKIIWTPDMTKNVFCLAINLKIPTRHTKAYGLPRDSCGRVRKLVRRLRGHDDTWKFF